MTTGTLGAAAALIAIANPLGALPVYLALRAHGDPAEHRGDAWRSALAVGITLAACALVGTRVLDAFGVQVAGLRAAGGLIITAMAFSMVQGERPGAQFSRGDQEVAASHEEASFGIYVPLSIPLIAGPGAMTTTITLAASPEVGVPATLAAVAAVCLLVFLTVFFARTWHRVLGDFGLRLATRILGLLVMAVGVQMVVAGVRELWAG
ncbi:MAG TPA: MarC family protein [Gemmatimonadota bacterium]|nr:MarC family protein [Gemmatimonadota bacterium]